METLDLQPPVLEWRVYRNDTTTMTLVLVDSNDIALDLTDWTFTGKVREFPTSATVLATMSIVKNENILTIALSTVDLEGINYFDIQGINSVTDAVSTIVRGQVFLEEDVTR
jgi:hypothetical protein